MDWIVERRNGKVARCDKTRVKNGLGHCEISQLDQIFRINRFRGDNVLQRPVSRGTIGQIRRSCGVKFTIVR